MFYRERLAEIVEGFGQDELEVMIEIAERIATGREVYGELELDTDKRDFGHEAAEEAQDLLVYLAADKIRKRRHRGKR